MASKTRPDDDDISKGPLCSLCFCDSVIYNIIMHVVIFGTVAPLFYHLYRNNEYFSTVSFLLGAQVVSALFQFGSDYWSEGLAYGSLSHVFGVTAIFLLLRLISPVLAMRTCIPILVWVGIIFVYQICSCFGGALESDKELERAVEDLL